jgi:hypothetical protein
MAVSDAANGAAPTISVYIEIVTREGGKKTKIIGTIPTPTKEFQNLIRQKYQPTGRTFISENLNGIVVRIDWRYDQVQGICFLSEAAAREYPGFKPSEDEFP